MKKKLILENCILSILLLFFSIIMFFPFALMVITSLKSMNEIQSPVFNFIPEQILYSNYYIAMTRGNWGRYIYNSFIITLITVLISLLFNSMAGYAFSRLNFPGRDLLFFSILLGIMVPAQVTLVPMFIMMKKFPLAGGNDIFGVGGTGLINTHLGLIIPFAAGSFGIFLCRQFFMNFPKSLDEAAEIDGAGKLRTFFQIYIPLSKPILATLGVLKTVASWNDYIWPLVMTNREEMRTVQLGLTIFRSETSIEWNLLMAATTIVLLPLILMFLFAQKYFVQGIVTSGIKG